MPKEYDVCIIRGQLSVWSRGQFDKWAMLSLAQPKEYVTIGRFRYYKEELDNPLIRKFVCQNPLDE